MVNSAPQLTVKSSISDKTKPSTDRTMNTTDEISPNDSATYKILLFLVLRKFWHRKTISYFFSDYFNLEKQF